jgi:hypothetical protein
VLIGYIGKGDGLVIMPFTRIAVSLITDAVAWWHEKTETKIVVKLELYRY